jgi:phospholipid/cholesterol/gamma-HCH transport system substrate-binding protein
LPSQQELKWSKLRVGITVLIAALTLAALIIVMGKSTGILVKKVRLTTYFNNAEGLRDGAAVRVEGVDVGNVTKVTIVPGQPLPVKVEMKVTTKYGPAIRKQSHAVLETAGVLGETFIDISSINADGGPVQDGDTLPSEDRPGIQEVVKSSQSTLENVNILVKRLDGIVATIDSGEGSIGKLINDPSLVNNANQTLAKLQQVADEVQNGKGSIGKLLNDPELYNRLNSSVEKLDRTMDAIDRGQGSIGKFVKDPSLYNNANQTITKANALIDEINNGKGAIGLLARDQQFAAKLDSTLTRVQNIMDRLDQGEGSAGRILRDPALYNDTDQAVIEMRNLLQAVRQNPKKYLSIRLHIF